MFGEYDKYRYTVKKYRQIVACIQCKIYWIYGPNFKFYDPTVVCPGNQGKVANISFLRIPHIEITADMQ